MREGIEIKYNKSVYAFIIPYIIKNVKFRKDKRENAHQQADGRLHTVYAVSE